MLNIGEIIKPLKRMNNMDTSLIIKIPSTPLKEKYTKEMIVPLNNLSKQSNEIGD